MSSPWAKITKPEPVNLQDIMSEEVAKDLQKKENDKYFDKAANFTIDDEIPQEVLDALKDDFVGSVDSDSDAAIAQMLQLQYDKEHDMLLKKTEEKYNGASKVSVSFKNFMRANNSLVYESESEEEEIEDIAERKDWDRFDSVNREFSSIPPCGYKVTKDGNVITKHDGVISGRKNACKLLSFPPEFHTGDGENFDLKLSNKVFNSLKIHSQNEQSRRHKMRDIKEDRATAEFGLDEFTRLLLYKMINNQVLEQVNGVISIGKEALILHADGCPSYEKAVVPKECVIKVFKTTLSEYKQRDKYIKDDHRFKDRVGKQTARKTVHLWAEKEMANLCRLKRAGIPCPDVVALKKHVLVMSFIGENHKAAAKLKDAKMEAADYILAYDQVISMMKKLFNEANLIHADLSEYNILWHIDQCYFIDVSQSVEPIHENAFHFLMRDCRNIAHFFQKKLVPEVLAPEELFRCITGCDFDDTEKLLSLKESTKLKPHIINSEGFEFEDNFEKVWDKVAEPVTEKFIEVENIS